jgi:hypothetical protein
MGGDRPAWISATVPRYLERLLAQELAFFGSQTPLRERLKYSLHLVY